MSHRYLDIWSFRRHLFETLLQYRHESTIQAEPLTSIGTYLDTQRQRGPKSRLTSLAGSLTSWPLRPEKGILFQCISWVYPASARALLGNSMAELLDERQETSTTFIRMLLNLECRAPALQRPTFTPCGENHSIWRITSQLMARMCSLRLCFKVPYAHRVFERSLVLANETTLFSGPWLPLQSGIQKFEPPYIINTFKPPSTINWPAPTVAPAQLHASKTLVERSLVSVSSSPPHWPPSNPPGTEEAATHDR